MYAETDPDFLVGKSYYNPCYSFDQTFLPISEPSNLDVLDLCLLFRRTGILDDLLCYFFVPLSPFSTNPFYVHNKLDNDHAP